MAEAKLDGLPREALARIAAHLTHRDATSLACACRSLHRQLQIPAPEPSPRADGDPRDLLRMSLARVPLSPAFPARPTSAPLRPRSKTRRNRRPAVADKELRRQLDQHMTLARQGDPGDSWGSGSGSGSFPELSAEAQPRSPLRSSGGFLGRDLDFARLAGQGDSAGAREAAEALVRGFARQTRGDAEAEEAAIRSGARAVAERMRECPAWRSLPDSRFAIAVAEMREYLFRQLHDTLVAKKDLARKDADIVAHLDSIRHLLTPRYFDLRGIDEDLLAAASHELENMQYVKGPREKLACIFNCCRILICIIQNSPNPSGGADEFLPLLIYVVAQTRMSSLWSNIAYIERFAASDDTEGESHCYYTHLCSAVAYLMTLTPDGIAADMRDDTPSSATPSSPVSAKQPEPEEAAPFAWGCALRMRYWVKDGDTYFGNQALQALFDDSRRAGQTDPVPPLLLGLAYFFNSDFVSAFEEASTSIQRARFTAGPSASSVCSLALFIRGLCYHHLRDEQSALTDTVEALHELDESGETEIWLPVPFSVPGIGALSAVSKGDLYHTMGYYILLMSRDSADDERDAGFAHAEEHLGVATSGTWSSRGYASLHMGVLYTLRSLHATEEEAQRQLLSKAIECYDVTIDIAGSTPAVFPLWADAQSLKAYAQGLIGQREEAEHSLELAESIDSCCWKFDLGKDLKDLKWPGLSACSDQRMIVKDLTGKQGHKCSKCGKGFICSECKYYVHALCLDRVPRAIVLPPPEQS
eukprot:m51a1_g6356 hypothetical protein (757) ;mRNA; r:93461-96540